MNVMSSNNERIVKNPEAISYSNQLLDPEIRWKHREPLFAAELRQTFSGKKLCILELVREFLLLAQLESCGQCLFCREGLLQATQLVTNTLDGLAQPQDRHLLMELAETMKQGAACGLGRVAADIVLTTTDRFGQEYESHIRERRCSAKGRIETIVPSYFENFS